MYPKFYIFCITINNICEKEVIKNPMLNESIETRRELILCNILCVH